MVTGWVFALTATILNSVGGLLESDATRNVHRGRWLVTQKIPRSLSATASSSPPPSASGFVS